MSFPRRVRRGNRPVLVADRDLLAGTQEVWLSAINSSVLGGGCGVGLVRGCALSLMLGMIVLRIVLISKIRKRGNHAPDHVHLHLRHHRPRDPRRGRPRKRHPGRAQARPRRASCCGKCSPTRASSAMRSQLPRAAPPRPPSPRPRSDEPRATERMQAIAPRLSTGPRALPLAAVPRSTPLPSRAPADARGARAPRPRHTDLRRAARDRARRPTRPLPPALRDPHGQYPLPPIALARDPSCAAARSRADHQRTRVHAARPRPAAPINRRASTWPQQSPPAYPASPAA